MIRAVASLVLAWLLFNVALFMVLGRYQAQQLSRRTIDRFRRAIGGR
jgi:hypothetical protein